MRSTISGTRSSSSTVQTKRWPRWLKILSLLVVLAGVIGLVGWYKLLREEPQHFDSQEEKLKYGSIGTEAADPVSGAAPHRSYCCRVERLTDAPAAA